MIYLPISEWCAAAGEGSWSWWLKGCWKLDWAAAVEVTAVVAVGLYVGALLVAAYRRGQGPV